MKHFFLIILIVGLSGCSSLMTGAPERPVSVKAELEITAFAFQESTFRAYDKLKDPAARKRERDRIVNAQIAAYDLKFEAFEGDLFAYGVTTGLGADFLGLGISGLTAVYGGKQTKEVLGALNTGLTGAKGSIDKRLFQEKATSAIAAEMINQRTAVLLDIRTGLAEADSAYNLYQALSDIVRYRSAGTLFGGLNGIVKTAGEETAENQEKIKSIVSRQFQEDRAGEILAAFIFPNGQLDSARATRLKTMMNDTANLNLQGIGVAELVYTSDFAAARVRAVEALGLGD